MVNVIIPVYKAKDTLSIALNSLISQTKKMFWVTIVNDCDGEDYSEIINEYENRGLHIAYIIRNENGGPGLARQEGIDASFEKFDYLMFLDADDMLMPRAIEVLYREAKLNNYDIVVGNFFGEGMCTSKIEYGKETQNNTWLHGKIYRTKYLQEKNIRFLPQFFYNEDSYFNAVALNCSKNIARINEVVYLWRNNQNSITRSMGRKKFIQDFHYGYIVGQITSCFHIKQINESLNFEYICSILRNIYQASMILASISNNWDWEKDIKVLKRLPELKSAQSGINFFRKLYSELPQGEWVDKEFVLYPMNVVDWYNKYLGED